MNRKYSNLFRIFFSFSDLFALNLINLILLRQYNMFITSFYEYTVFCIFNNMLWLICSHATSIYANDQKLIFRKFFKRTFISFSVYFFIDFLFILFKPAYYNKAFILYSLFGYLLFLLISRLIVNFIITYVFKKDEFQKKVVFIGCNKISEELIIQFKQGENTLSIEGFFDDNRQDNGSGYPILGRVNDCLAYAKQNKITEIYSTLSPKAHPDLYNIAQAAEQFFIRFKFIPDLTEFINHNCQLDFIENTPILSLRREPMESVPGRIKKRIFDIIFSSFIIVFILSWLIPVLGMLIMIDSKGPIFFTQIRSGKNNRPFRVIKLRTLKVNAEADVLQVTRNDKRITRLGRFLRKSNLDELPQFFNVLVGNMSIVGSRPHMLKHTEEYSKMHNGYMVRHFMKPGVTGWAQVNGHRGEIKQHDQLKKRVEHDIWYLENWNMWLDFRIVYLTLFSTIKGDKNAF